jgi:Endonuclease-reverse transcriptase
MVTVTLRLIGGTQMINVYNVYNPPPTSHNDETGIATFIALNDALTMPGRHIVVGDFNLHHPWWCEPTYAHQHRIADRLLNIMRDTSLELALPRGTITREARRGDITEKTTIDLVWTSTDLIGQLTYCRIVSEMEQSLDHLSIATEIATQDAVITQALRKRRLWIKMDIEAFDTSLKQEISELEQNPFINRDDIEKIVEGLTQAISKAIDCATPWARPCKYSKPWWTLECQEAVRLTRYTRNLYIRTQSQEA